MFSFFNTLKINPESPDKADIKALLEEHLSDMYATSPAESVHALELTELMKPTIMFLTARRKKQLQGCVAIKALGGGKGEIKSMRTVTEARRQGVGKALMDAIMEIAASRGYQTLYLETGSMEYFEPARELYKQYGFVECGPFEGYTEDPNSVFMMLDMRNVVPTSL